MSDAPTFKEVTDVQSAKNFARHAISSTYFDVGIGAVILLNAGMISIEQEIELNGQDTIAFKVLDSFFLVIYLVELWLRFFAEGFYTCLRDSWIRCDIFLVLAGVLSAWILDPLMGGSQLGPLMVLRMLRLLRLVKTARLLRRIQEFWMLIRGLLNSCTIMVYVLGIMIVVLYIFACAAIELITKHDLNNGESPDPEFQEHVEKYFRNLPQAMLTLMRFIAMDNACEVYKPLVDKNPWLALYFVVVMLVTSIVLMNLITAVIFVSMQEENHRENETAQKNAEDGWTLLIRDLKFIFTRLDPEKSGKLNAQKMTQISEEDRQLLVQTLGIDKDAKPVKVFQSLDRFKRGEITIAEFYDCIAECVMGRGEIHMKRMERQFEKMYWRQKDIFDIQQEEIMTYKKLYDNVEQVVSLLKNGQHVRDKSCEDKTIPSQCQPAFSVSQEEEIKVLPNGKAKRQESKTNGLDDSLLSHAVCKASELSNIISSWESSMRLALDSLKDFTDTVKKGIASEPKKVTQLQRQISPRSNDTHESHTSKQSSANGIKAMKQSSRPQQNPRISDDHTDWKEHGM